MARSIPQLVAPSSAKSLWTLALLFAMLVGAGLLALTQQAPDGAPRLALARWSAELRTALAMPSSFAALEDAAGSLPLQEVETETLIEEQSVDEAEAGAHAAASASASAASPVQP
jgi:hypothetical protein